MKAVIIERYGSPDVLQYADIEKPSVTGDRLLIKIYASSINPIDWKLRQGMLKVITGNKFPMILGFDVAGEVVEVGANITNFKTGDGVYAYLNPVPGGAYAEYVAVSERFVSLKPSNLSYEQAAVVPLAATTALQALRDTGEIKKGQKVLINGAAGGVGTFAVQIAKAYETEVTAVCSAKNVELVKSLGADSVIDYTQQDFTKDTEKYDIIFDVVGKRSFSECKNNLLDRGIYITLLPSPDIILNGFLTFLIPGKKAKLFVAKANDKDLAYLKELIEANKIRPIIDRIYPLSQIADAHRYSEEGRTVGKIAIAIE
ncbi:NAD(P)-dependent alcohol dehydrogenase [Candidatus Gracilibacteria bacterium]|nr:NAD(P)-dependent alcohol dehydrogenase [Candidatus Gracilibacteria bacterium]NJM88810.1 NAD(P)-dependent alcohol dehydrogenase [Hydrococcus sp. RU_2_2]NJP19355.1 NAD(P)-dependent alcohol dehydrogenase [Hydrococcus sp. CRU_1_1]